MTNTLSDKYMDVSLWLNITDIRFKCWSVSGEICFEMKLNERTFPAESHKHQRTTQIQIQGGALHSDSVAYWDFIVLERPRERPGAPSQQQQGCVTFLWQCWAEGKCIRRHQCFHSETETERQKGPSASSASSDLCVSNQPIRAKHFSVHETDH